MSINAVLTDRAPKPIGPYSQAISVKNPGGLLFCSGQIPLNPSTGKIETDDVVEQTRIVMNHLKAVVEQGGSELGKVIRCTIFLKDMNDFPKVNEIYGSYFQGVPPSRACVEVARLPKDVKVEIDAIALI